MYVTGDNDRTRTYEDRNRGTRKCPIHRSSKDIPARRVHLLHRHSALILGSLTRVFLQSQKYIRFIFYFIVRAACVFFLFFLFLIFFFVFYTLHIIFHILDYTYYIYFLKRHLHANAYLDCKGRASNWIMRIKKSIAMLCMYVRISTPANSIDFADPDR